MPLVFRYSPSILASIMFRWISFGRLLIFLAGAAAPIKAAVTVAWKIPAELAATAGASFKDKIHKLDKPPGESAFIQTDDVLWDLSGIISEQIASKSASTGTPSKNWPGEWIVWNERSGMVVARGKWNEILDAETGIGIDQWPQNLRLKMNLRRGENQKQVTLITAGSGQASADEDGFGIKVESTGPVGAKPVDLVVHASWPDGESTWTANTPIVAGAGTTLSIARKGGKAGWELSMELEREFTGGTPVSKLRQVEGGNSKAALSQAFPQRLLQQAIDATRTLAVYRLPAGYFDDTATKPISELKVPADLQPWIGSGLLDMSPFLAGEDIATSAPDFMAGYDPLTSQMFVAADEATLKKCDKWWEAAFGYHTGPLEFETNPAGGDWCLTCKSGGKASISRTTAGKEDLAFKIEPTLSAASWIIDVQYEITLATGSTPPGKLNSSIALLLGQPVEIERYSAAGLEVPVTLSCRMLDAGR